MIFGEQTVEKILADFYQAIEKLEARAERLLVKITKRETDAAEAWTDAAIHRAEHQKAGRIADKLKELLKA